MNETFRVFVLLKILITTAITLSESERCFSILKRIQICLRSTMEEERLNALTMMNIENKMIFDYVNLSKKVIDMLSEKNIIIDADILSMKSYKFYLFVFF